MNPQAGQQFFRNLAQMFGQCPGQPGNQSTEGADKKDSDKEPADEATKTDSQEKPHTSGDGWTLLSDSASASPRDSADPSPQASHPGELRFFVRTVLSLICGVKELVFLGSEDYCIYILC